MKMKAALYSALILCTAANPAWAYKGVSTMNIIEGETTLEVKGEYLFDESSKIDGSWQNKVTLGHAFTSWWASEIETNVQRTGGGLEHHTDFTAIDWKNKFQFTRQKDFGFDTGFRFSYGKDLTGQSDRIDARFVAVKDIGNFQHRINLILDRRIDDYKGMNWGLAWGTRYKVTDMVQPGFEIYDGFGPIGNEKGFNDGDHRIGPSLYGKLTDKISYDGGYLFGLSNQAPDGTLKLNLRFKL